MTRLPWRKLMRFMGPLGWAPSEFWSATIVELYAAMEGLAEFHGADPDVPDQPAGKILSADEVAHLRALMADMDE